GASTRGWRNPCGGGGRAASLTRTCRAVWCAWGWAAVARAKGTGVVMPSVPLRARAAWSWAGVARADGWSHRPFACPGGVELGWRGPRGRVVAPSVPLRAQAAWGWVGVARGTGGRTVVACPSPCVPGLGCHHSAEGGGRAVRPLACPGGMGGLACARRVVAPSVPLRARAGRGAGWRPTLRGLGAWGWADVAHAEGAGAGTQPLLLCAGRVGRVGLSWHGPCREEWGWDGTRGAELAWPAQREVGVVPPSLLLRQRGMWGWAGLVCTCAKGDWGGRHRLLLRTWGAHAEGSEVGAPVPPLAVCGACRGWAGVARIKGLGWACRPPSCVQRAGRRGMGRIELEGWGVVSLLQYLSGVKGGDGGGALTRGTQWGAWGDLHERRCKRGNVCGYGGDGWGACAEEWAGE
ncbi:hypothetical protein EDB89DRAFT_1907420, partial [Lactarius sanguifluus]